MVGSGAGHQDDETIVIVDLTRLATVYDSGLFKVNEGTPAI